MEVWKGMEPLCHGDSGWMSGGDGAHGVGYGAPSGGGDGDGTHDGGEGGWCDGGDGVHSFS